MLVTITQSGGIAGARRTLGPADTSRLDPAAANRIRAALDRVDWDHVPAPPYPEVETRSLVVEEAGARQTVSWHNDGSAPAWALALVAAVEVVAVWA